MLAGHDAVRGGEIKILGTKFLPAFGFGQAAERLVVRLASMRIVCRSLLLIDPRRDIERQRHLIVRNAREQPVGGSRLAIGNRGIVELRRRKRAQAVLQIRTSVGGEIERCRCRFVYGDVIGMEGAAFRAERKHHPRANSSDSHHEMTRQLGTSNGVKGAVTVIEDREILDTKDRTGCSQFSLTNIRQFLRRTQRRLATRPCLSPRRDNEADDYPFAGVFGKRPADNSRFVIGMGEDSKQASIGHETLLIGCLYGFRSGKTDDARHEEGAGIDARNASTKWRAEWAPRNCAAGSGDPPEAMTYHAGHRRTFLQGEGQAERYERGAAMQELTVGEAALAAAVSVKAIRYWESKGLIPKARRTASGYRLFTDTDVARLRFIRQAKMLSLTLGEIAEIMQLRDAGRCPCDKVAEAIEAHLAAIDRSMAELVQFKRTLTLARNAPVTPCRDGSRGTICRMVNSFEA